MMPTPQLKLDSDGSIIVSASQIEVMQTCASMFAWRYLYRRVRRAAPAARAAGKAFDAALRVRHGHAATPEIEAAMLSALHKGYEGVELDADEYRTEARFADVVRAYNAFYPEAGWQVLGTQMPLMVDLGTVTGGLGALLVRYRFIPDLMVRHEGELWLVDDKTMNKWDGQRLISFENSGQAKGYVWSTQKLVREGKLAGVAPEERVAGFILNAVVVREPYKSDRKRGKELPREEFHRIPFRYSEERLEEWRQDALAWVQTMLGWVQRDRFPQSEKHCSHHYGKPCPYLSVCMSPPEQRALALSFDEFEDYREGPWAAGHADAAEAEAI